MLSSKITRRTFMTAVTLAAVAGTNDLVRAAALSNKLYIIHINDVHGFAMPSDTAIGYPKLAGFIQEFRAAHPNTIVLDAGDAFAGSPHAAFDKGESILNTLNTLGLDAFSVGNADLAIGTEVLKQRVKPANFPILSANIVRMDGSPVFPGETVITTAEGLRVGVVGLTVPLSRPGDIKSLDIVEAAQAAIDRLKPQTDVLVALSHLGDGPKDVDNSLRLARETKGFDVIIDGHSHSVLPEGRIENGVLIAQAGDYGKYAGIVELDLSGNRAAGAKARLMDKKEFASMPEKPETAAVIASLDAASSAYFAEVVGKTSTDLDGSRKTARTGESNAGNLLADAMREKGKSDAAVVIAGAIGGEIKAGNLTRQDVMTIVRVNVDIKVFEVTGADIAALLTPLIASWPEQNGTFPQISGISFRLKPGEGGAKNAPADITVGGKPLDVNKKYTLTISSNPFLIKELKGGIFLRDAGDLEEAMTDYLVKNSPVSPKAEGRIKTPKI